MERAVVRGQGKSGEPERCPEALAALIGHAARLQG